MNQIKVELQEWMGTDASICNAAWTSTYDKERREEKYDDPEKVAALVPRLIREGHATPVESVVLRFWMKWPIFVDRQHMTHRIASHNGQSARYRKMPTEFFTLPPDVRGLLLQMEDGSGIIAGYNTICESANVFYSGVVDKLKEHEKFGGMTNAQMKRAREVLRGVLPTSNLVERVTVMNLRSFANYQRLRNSEHAQPEIKFAAGLMLDEVEKKGIAPLAIAALKEVGWRI